MPPLDDFLGAERIVPFGNDQKDLFNRLTSFKKEQGMGQYGSVSQLHILLSCLRAHPYPLPSPHDNGGGPISSFRHKLAYDFR